MWSPNRNKPAFVEKEFRDVYEIDIETNAITCLTCEFRHECFLRVHYMKD